MNTDNNHNTITELQMKLEDAQIALQKCKEETNEFIHFAAHELSAPVRKLSVFTEQLTKKFIGSTEEESGVYSKKIIAMTDQLMSIIDGLSKLSEYETADYDFVQCDLGSILKKTIEDYEADSGLTDANISVASLPVVEGNATLMGQLFKNLLENAIHFHKEGTAPMITIHSEILKDDEKDSLQLQPQRVYHKIEFIDNGIGFNQVDADKIFKPFKRLHGRSAYPGNGLGLAICKKITELHFGTIYAKGNENSGAQLVVILPEKHTSNAHTK